MQKLVVANWKMNPASVAEAEALYSNLAKAAALSDQVLVIACLPAVWLGRFVGQTPRGFKLSAQNVYPALSGAFTGETGLGMIKAAGAEYVLLGHSERRRFFKEDDAQIVQKAQAALAAGLKVIVAVGDEDQNTDEPEWQRLSVQLGAVAKLWAGTAPENFILAYEPVWAISTTPGSHVASTQYAQGVIKRVRGFFKDIDLKKRPVVIYGGSVDDKTAAGFTALPEIDGVLPGAACLKPEVFYNLVAAVAKTT